MTIRFGNFEFDTDARRLRRGGEEVRLEPKAFGLLGILLSRRPAVVPKHELHARLWPDTLVTDTTLSSLVSGLRRALGDEAHDGLIRTVHGFGYAFVGEASDDAKGPTAVLTRPWVIWDGATFALGPGENVLGRVEDGAVFVDDASVSRKHARIVVDGRRATLEDLGSRNGTWVGTERLTGPAPLQDGDTFRLGSARLEFHRTSKPGATQPLAGSVPDEA
jgi:DNA-binding winged helix-turn-helix (wHTH) protein